MKAFMAPDGSLLPAMKEGGELSLWGPALVELIRGVLDRNVPVRLRAKGFSMSPFIRNGDVITLFPSAGNSIHLGDVVAFVPPGTERLVIHRVIAKNGNALLITGDNLTEADGLVPQESILARVGKVERNGKEVLLGLGPERLLIVFLARTGLLFHVFLPLWQRLCPVTKRLFRR
jgi:signal peptidase I